MVRGHFKTKPISLIEEHGKKILENLILFCILKYKDFFFYLLIFYGQKSHKTLSQITWVPMHGLTIIRLNYISGFSLLINDILCPKISLNFNNIDNMLTISWLNYTSGRWPLQEGRQLTVLWQAKYKSLKVPQKNWWHHNKNPDNNPE